MGKLSQPMTAVMGGAREKGGTLVLEGGRYWTWPGCPAMEGRSGVPAWFATRETVNALIRTGHLEVTRRANGLAVEVRVAGMVPA